MGLQMQADIAVARGPARWMLSGCAWMQGALEVEDEVLAIVKPQRRSQATQSRSAQSIRLFFLVGCGVRCQDPWDERGWVE